MRIMLLFSDPSFLTDQMREMSPGNSKERSRSPLSSACRFSVPAACRHFLPLLFSYLLLSSFGETTVRDSFLFLHTSEALLQTSPHVFDSPLASSEYACLMWAARLLVEKGGREERNVEFLLQT